MCVHVIAVMLELLPFLPVPQAQQLLTICREYVLGLTMEMTRKEMPKVHVHCTYPYTCMYSYGSSATICTCVHVLVHVQHNATCGLC